MILRQGSPYDVPVERPAPKLFHCPRCDTYWSGHDEFEFLGLGLACVDRNCPGRAFAVPMPDAIVEGR